MSRVAFREMIAKCHQSLFPLKTILFPDGHLPLQVFEVRYLDLVKRCIAKGEEFGVVSLLDGSEVRVPDQHETLSACGTMARILDWSAPLPGLLQISCIGTTRFQVKSAEQLKHGLWMAEVEEVAEDMVVPSRASSRTWPMRWVR
jgi:Lon protease-like protein